MKKWTIAALLAFGSMASHAQEQIPAWIKNIRLSGYAMAKYEYNGQKDKETNGFSLRFARLSLDGRIAKEWYWKFQLQINGNNTNLTVSPRVVDIFAEWQKYEFFRVKAGQFKRPFTFESPMSPIDQGFMGFSQNVSRLSYFSDRSGAVSSNGRDLGIQVQGDLIKNAKGRNLFHYQVGLFNGQGINVSDVDNQKDIIGGIWVMPVAGMRLGVFGSEGSYAREGTWTDEQGENHTGVRKLPQHRYAISGEYKVNDWTIRSEYIHSTGKAFSVTANSSADLKNATVNNSIGSKADGVYALVIAPAIKKKLYVKARYDLYRNTASWDDSRTQYEIGANYFFNKNIQLNTEYALINDRSLVNGHNYSMLDMELCFQF
jgi:hypothetical protein